MGDGCATALGDGAPRAGWPHSTPCPEVPGVVVGLQGFIINPTRALGDSADTDQPQVLAPRQVRGGAPKIISTG